MNAIEIERVTKTFGSTVAVNDLSLTVPEGSIYGFIGPNGSGKTTTMRMIANIYCPDEGSVRVFGSQGAARSGWVGYLPEERGLYKKMALREMLEFFAELKGGRNVGAEVDGWLKKLDLAHCAGRKVETLSKGMSQKAQFIAAVVPRPKLLILDEPFSGLDPVSADAIRAEVLEMRCQGVTIILSTHDMHVAESFCEFIFMIFRGKKVLDGPLEEIQNQFGADTIRLECEGGAAALGALTGVEAIRDLGQVQELRMAAGCDSQDVLRQVMARTRVAGFSVTKPSLHDIFVRIAGPSAEEAAHA